MELRPYTLGFNGHAKCCQCKPCTRDRVKSFKVWYSQQAKLPLMPDPTRTVFVRPHWRRQKGHLKKMPVFRKALIKEFLE